MGAIITNDIISMADASLTMRSADAGYPKGNMLVLDSLSQRSRANDVTTNNYLWKYDFGSAQSVAGVIMVGVNFDTIHIHGHASDIWDGSPPYSPSFDSGAISISLNEIVNRYHVYIPLTAFNYRWIAAFIPSGASAAGDYTTKWQVRSMCAVETAPELAVNFGYGYEEWPEQAHEDTKLQSGGIGRVGMNDLWQWNAKVPFTPRRATSSMSELRTIGTMDRHRPVIWYKNNSDTSEVYICLRGDEIKTELIRNGLHVGSRVTFKELL